MFLDLLKFSRFLKLGVRYFNYLAVGYILIKIICLMNKGVIVFSIYKLFKSDMLKRYSF